MQLTQDPIVNVIFEVTCRRSIVFKFGFPTKHLGNDDFLFNLHRHERLNELALPNKNASHIIDWHFL